jgi:mannose-6-phosphate isomerase-like protein (cupin superfamily)
MFIKNKIDCPEFEAGDKTLLRELIHPNNDSLDIGYSLAEARIEPGQSSLIHSLKSSELYYVLDGEGIIYIDTESRSIKKGDLVMVPADSTQSVTNNGKNDLIFLCIVEPFWTASTENII